MRSISIYSLFKLGDAYRFGSYTVIFDYIELRVFGSPLVITLIPPIPKDFFDKILD